MASNIEHEHETQMIAFYANRWAIPLNTCLKIDICLFILFVNLQFLAKNLQIWYTYYYFPNNIIIRHTSNVCSYSSHVFSIFYIFINIFDGCFNNFFTFKIEVETKRYGHECREKFISSTCLHRFAYINLYRSGKRLGFKPFDGTNGFIYIGDRDWKRLTGKTSRGKNPNRK